MRLLASFACSALALLSGCILVYDPGDFQIASGTGGGGTGGGGTGGGGTGGGLACSPQDPLDGAPLTPPPHVWTWIPVPETKCRNGSSTGFGIRFKPTSSKLFIFFDGSDGACFNAASCATNADSFSSADFDTMKNANIDVGIGNTSNPENPVRDWNAVYIPYCTGDVHAGDKTGNVLGGPQNQSFSGFKNVGHYMARSVPTFPDLTQVAVIGISAGGFGALYNYDRIARDFCPVPVVLIDDSGPLMSDSYSAPCLQARFRDLWGLDATLPTDCQEAIGPSGDGVNLITCLGDKYATGRLGIIAADKDSDKALFYGFGQNNCMYLDSGTPSPLSSTAYYNGLIELRTVYMKSPPWGSYFVDNTSSIFLSDAFYSTTTMGGVKLTSWVNDMVNGGPVVHGGP